MTTIWGATIYTIPNYVEPAAVWRLVPVLMGLASMLCAGEADVFGGAG